MNIKDIIGKRIAVHCDTEEKANIFLEECEKLGILWADDTNVSASCNYWEHFEKDTCYTINYGYLTHGDIGYLLKHEYLVYRFEDFFEGE